jgi:hypothetical protein
MRYLNKFVEYIKESNGKELDLDLVENEYLVPIKQLGVTADTYISVITTGEFSGYQLVNIRLHTSGFNKVDNDDRSPYYDKRIWEFLDELLMFKNVVDSFGGNEVSLALRYDRVDINIYVKIEEDAKYLTEKLLMELGKERSPKIQLDYDLDIPIIKAYVNGSLIVFNNFVRKIEADLSKFDIEVIQLNEKTLINIPRYWEAKNLINITAKKQ